MSVFIMNPEVVTGLVFLREETVHKDRSLNGSVVAPKMLLHLEVGHTKEKKGWSSNCCTDIVRKGETLVYYNAAA